jgi:hypothetical protein
VYPTKRGHRAGGELGRSSLPAINRLKWRGAQVKLS